MAKTIHIYLVRHGESVANTEGRYQGVTYDTHLSELGKKQAEALSQRLRAVQLDCIIASPLLRTRETAAAVGMVKRCGVEIEPKIIETNHGLWESKYKTDISKTWPELYKKWLKFPSAVQFPGGEHFLDTQKRVIAWWEEYCHDSRDTLIVTHDNIIRILIARILNMKLNRIWKFALQPTGVTLIRIGNNHVTLLQLNDTRHLGDLQVNLENHAL